MRSALSQPLRRPALTVAVPIIVIGLVATVLALSNRAASPVFIYQQRLTSVQPAAVAHLASLASDPRPDLGHTAARSAFCVADGSGELRNPWFCTVRYQRGSPVRYRVIVSPTGHVAGVDRSGQLLIHACCIDVTQH